MEFAILEAKWKTEFCNVGETCWCRLIVPVDHLNKDEYVIPDGSVQKEIAEHICDVHNRWLEENKINQKHGGESCKDVQLYLGNYGFPIAEYPHCEPPTLPKWAWDFVDQELIKNISRMNRISWIQDRLKILSDMLEDREQKYFADEIRKLIVNVGK